MNQDVIRALNPAAHVVTPGTLGAARFDLVGMGLDAGAIGRDLEAGAVP